MSEPTTGDSAHKEYRRKKDNFASEYAGRMYEKWEKGPDGNYQMRWVGGVEMPSVGMEKIYVRPGEFMLRDPIHFFLTFGFMNNDLIVEKKK